jgi:ABC-type phosphate transport system permease subunit
MTRIIGILLLFLVMGVMGIGIGGGVIYLMQYGKQEMRMVSMEIAIHNLQPPSLPVAKKERSRNGS